MRILRNIFRRKLRAFLTIFGISIGVFALVVMGAMSEKLSLLVDGGVKYYADKVVVNAATSVLGLASEPLTMSKLRDVRHVPGVEAAFATVGILYDEELPTVSMGNIATLQGEDWEAARYESFKVGMAEGRDLESGDHGVVVLGNDLAKKQSAYVGKVLTIRDREFEVVGILERTLTSPDNMAAISLEDAQEVYKDTLPDALQSGVTARNLATGFVVYPEKGVDPDQLAATIERHVNGVEATGPKAFQERVVSQVSVLSSVIFGIGAISLLVGGLSVVNTMTMSVAERTREIGIRKAIGASSGQIMRQFIAESAVIGLLGGAAGLALGWVVAGALNAAGEASGNVLFLVTPGLAIQSVLFAVFLGVVAGLYPAWHAAQLNPVEALRYE
ncbi:MAG: ABC transporter permease [Actinobacteria bacterium]|nr:MAG: ABC transporter permease [Actinomycetota bacterium]